MTKEDIENEVNDSDTTLQSTETQDSDELLADELLSMHLNPQYTHNPYFHRGIERFSIIIEINDFDGLTFEKSGPSSLLSILRNQYKDVLGLRKCSTGDDDIGDYLEIGFQNAALRGEALRKEFIVQDRRIKAIRPISYPPSRITRMDVSGLPFDLKEDSHIWIERNFKKFGQVLHYCLHCTEDGDWFTGNAYVIVASNEPCEKKYGTCTTERYDQLRTMQVKWSKAVVY